MRPSSGQMFVDEAEAVVGFHLLILNVDPVGSFGDLPQLFNAQIFLFAGLIGGLRGFGA